VRTAPWKCAKSERHAPVGSVPFLVKAPFAVKVAVAKITTLSAPLCRRARGNATREEKRPDWELNLYKPLARGGSRCLVAVNLLLRLSRKEPRAAKIVPAMDLRPRNSVKYFTIPADHQQLEIKLGTSKPRPQSEHRPKKWGSHPSGKFMSFPKCPTQSESCERNYAISQRFGTISCGGLVS